MTGSDIETDSVQIRTDLTVPPTGEAPTEQGRSTRRPPFWARFVAGNVPTGEHLAALRRGVGREPGSVPQLWPYYTTLTEDGHLTALLVAEHHALTLFGVHQQSQEQLMHRRSVGVGAAVLALRRSGNASEDAVDRRFAAAATSQSVGELAVHLRGLVTQLRGIHQPLDYDRLLSDLRDWRSTDGAASVRRRWGGQYFTAART